MKIQSGIFQGDALSPLLFSKSQEKINFLMYIDDIKLFIKNEKRIRNSNTRSEDIQSGAIDGIWHRKIRHASNEKRQTTLDGRNETAKLRQY